MIKECVHLRREIINFRTLAIHSYVFFLSMISRIFSFLVLIALHLTSNAQTFNPFYSGIVNEIQYDSITGKLYSFENLGIKEFGTSALTNTKSWIASKYADYGYTDIVYDDFTYFGQNLSNIIITKTGTHYPDTYVIIDAHYDTKNGKGTNDNGTGTAILMELARLIKDVPTEYSIKFIHFTAEEIGLIGSTNYVDQVVAPQNMDIKILFNIDEVGGVNGMTNDIIVCERDESSTPSTNNAQSWIMTDELATCVNLYSNLTPEIAYAYSSDYMPFEEHGEIITGLFEKNYSPYSHTSDDLFINLDPNYVFEVSKASMGALLHYAVAYDISSLIETENSTLHVFPNPAHDQLSILGGTSKGTIQQLSIISLNGQRQVFDFSQVDGHIKLNVSNLANGIYTIEIEEADGSFAYSRFIKN